MVGSVARVPKSVASGRLTQDTVKLVFSKPDEDFQTYVYWLLRTPHCRDYCAAHATGSVQSALGREDFLAYPVPELGETGWQTVLLLEALESKIEPNRRMNETLEAMAQALFKSWFVDFDPVLDKALAAGNPIPDAFADRAAQRADFLHGNLPSPSGRGAGGEGDYLALFPDRFADSELGPIPEGWEVRPLSHLARLQARMVNPSSSPDTTWEHYSIPAFDSGRVPASEQGESILSGKYTVPPTAVLVSKLNPQIPRVWLPDVTDAAVAVCSTEFMPFVPLVPSLRPFVFELLRSDLAQEGICSRVTGTTGSRQRAQPKEIAQMPVVGPPTQVAELFSRTVGRLHEQVLANTQQATTLAQARDALLPGLVSGQLATGTIACVGGEA